MACSASPNNLQQSKDYIESRSSESVLDLDGPAAWPHWPRSAALRQNGPRFLGSVLGWRLPQRVKPSSDLLFKPLALFGDIGGQGLGQLPNPSAALRLGHIG
jgi:hypothetical protein